MKFFSTIRVGNGEELSSTDFPSSTNVDGDSLKYLDTHKNSVGIFTSMIDKSSNVFLQGRINGMSVCD